MSTIVSKITIQDVRTAVTTKQFENMLEYPKMVTIREGHVFDEDKSVKWNREQFESLKATERAERDAWQREERRMEQSFTDMLTKAIMTELTICEAAAKSVANKAWEEGHSSGYSNILHYADDYVDLLSLVLVHERGNAKASPKS